MPKKCELSEDFAQLSTSNTNVGLHVPRAVIMKRPSGIYCHFVCRKPTDISEEHVSVWRAEEELTGGNQCDSCACYLFLAGLLFGIFFGPEDECNLFPLNVG
jgi:hypothetical protein